MSSTSDEAVRVPLLGAGRHGDPACGASLLELVSVLTDSTWTNRPPTVHPALAAVADAVNSLTTPQGRRALVPLAPWLCGTSTGQRSVTSAILRECANAALPHVGPRFERRLLSAVDAPEPGCRVDDLPRCRRLIRVWRHEHALRAVLPTIELCVRAYADALPAGPARDLRLSALLESCLNRVRIVLSTVPVAPRLELRACPDHIYVETHWAPHPTTGERAMLNRPADRSWLSRLVAASVPDGGQIRLDTPCLDCRPNTGGGRTRWLGGGPRPPAPGRGPGESR